MDEIKQIVDEIFEEVVLSRRTLHENPELSFCEHQTAAFVCSYLDKLGIPYQSGVAGTGVVGLIEAENATKTLLMRADMDALPMQEETNLPYKSKIPGVAHCCGHDAHVAILLGVSKVLMRLRHRLSANIKLVFQPGEETDGGALPMIQAGVMENPHVDAAVGGHVMNDVPVGKILVKSHEMMASPDDFEMVIRGRGGHGAYPHECVDPIAIAVQILTAWNALSARYTTPLEKHVLSVNVIHAGTAYNIIPDTARVSGTVRTYNQKLREELAEKMGSIAKQISAAFGAACDFTFNFQYPPLINDPAMTEAFAQSASKILGAENVVTKIEPSMAGDDFSEFALRVPSTYINYGSKNETKGITMPLHNSDFDIDEACLKTGMLSMCQFALDFGK